MRRVFFIFTIFILILIFLANTYAEVKVEVKSEKCKNDLWNLYAEGVKQEIKELQKNVKIFNTYYIQIKPLIGREKETICTGVLITSDHKTILEGGYTCGSFTKLLISEKEAIECGRLLGRVLFSIILEYENRNSI